MNEINNFMEAIMKKQTSTALIITLITILVSVVITSEATALTTIPVKGKKINSIGFPISAFASESPINSSKETVTFTTTLLTKNKIWAGSEGLIYKSTEVVPPTAYWGISSEQHMSTVIPDDFLYVVEASNGKKTTTLVKVNPMEIQYDEKSLKIFWPESETDNRLGFYTTRVFPTLE